MCQGIYNINYLEDPNTNAMTIIQIDIFFKSQVLLRHTIYRENIIPLNCDNM